jgi:hypothetical protein
MLLCKPSIWFLSHYSLECKLYASCFLLLHVDLQIKFCTESVLVLLTFAYSLFQFGLHCCRPLTQLCYVVLLRGMLKFGMFLKRGSNGCGHLKCSLFPSLKQEPNNLQFLILTSIATTFMPIFSSINCKHIWRSTETRIFRQLNCNEQWFFIGSSKFRKFKSNHESVESDHKIFQNAIISQ